MQFVSNLLSSNTARRVLFVLSCTTFLGIILLCVHFDEKSYAEMSGYYYYAEMAANKFKNFSYPIKIDCSDEENWPNLQLFLPLSPTNEHVDEFRDLLLPSYSLFWPVKRANSTFLIVTERDDNNRQTFARIQQLASVQLGSESLFRLEYSSMPQQLSGNNDGYDHLQWILFWADNFTTNATLTTNNGTTSNYVGFIDSDTIFVSRVAKSDLFDLETGRPIVRPLFGKSQTRRSNNNNNNNRNGGQLSRVQRSRHIPFLVSQRQSSFSCKTFFPVIVKVEHLADFREHIRKQLGMKTVEEAFAKLSGNYAYDHLDLLCVFLWYFKQGEYVWAVSHRDFYWEPGHMPVGDLEHLVSFGISNTELSRHGPRIANHGRVDQAAFRNILKSGICYSMLENDPRRPPYCSQVVKGGGIRKDSINVYEWTFEGGVSLTNKNLTWALGKHRQRLDMIDKCPHEWDVNIFPRY